MNNMLTSNDSEKQQGNEEEDVDGNDWEPVVDHKLRNVNSVEASGGKIIASKGRGSSSSSSFSYSSASSSAAGTTALGASGRVDSATTMNGGSSGSSGASQILLPKQYYYFYGSVSNGTETLQSDTVTNTNTNTTVESNRGGGEEEEDVGIRRKHSQSPGGNSTDDNNSLVGESLLLTDTELEDFTATRDIQQRHHHEQEQLLYIGTTHPLLRTNIASGNGAGNGSGSGSGSGNKTTKGLNHHHRKRKHEKDLDTSIMLHDSECCEKRPYVRYGLILVCTMFLVLVTTTFLFGTTHLRLKTQQSKYASPVLSSSGSQTATSSTTFADEQRSSTLNSNTKNNGGSNTNTNNNNDFAIPYRHIDRNNTNDPVTNFIDLSLFHPSLLSSSVPSKKMGASNNASAPTFVFPFPTGAFWTNLVLPPTADKGLSYPIAVYPYAYKWTTNQLQLSYPALHRVEDKLSIHDYFFPDLTFCTTTSPSSSKDSSDKVISLRYITTFDSLSVTLRYEGISTSMFWETYLVQGSPYATIKYKNVVPNIGAFSIFTNVVCPHQEQASNGGTITTILNRRRRRRQQQVGAVKDKNRRYLMKLSGVCTSSNYTTTVMSDVSNVAENHTIVSLSGIQFVLQTQEGIAWIMFVSEPVTLLFDSYKKTSVSFAEAFTGVLRIALIPPSTSTSTTLETSTGTSGKSDSGTKTSLDSSTGLQRLIYHAGVYPISGSVGWSFRDELTPSPYDSIANVPITTKIVLEALSLSGVANDNNMPTPTLESSVNATDTASSSSSQSTKSGRIGRITFKFETGTTVTPIPPLIAGTAPKPLLTLALPHHAQSLDPSIQLDHNSFDLVYKCIKGPMRPVVGSSWSYSEPLLSIGFDGGTGSNLQDTDKQFLHPNVRTKIMESLHQDIKLVLPTLTEDIYGFGKQAARLAQLAYIAGVIRNSGNLTTQSTEKVESSINAFDAPALGQEDVEALTLQQEALSILKDRIVSLLLDKTVDTLLYDTSLGGLITSNGLFDSHADFGNGRYNDHHFHYGYLLYACAILGKLDPTFVEHYASHVDAIYFDVANDSNFNSYDVSEDVFYPASRHKIWYDGHSFASGMFPFGNGKSQESSSEAVNCYYGAYLWSLVRNGAADNPSSDTSARTDFARLLLASEITGAKFYWHMVPPNSSASYAGSSSGVESDISTVYSPTFSQNFMVGNLGMLDALCSTWFGTESLYVHMINLIPVTAVTGELFGPSYAALEYKQTLEPLGTVEMAWNGFVIADRAISDPQGAWSAAQDVFSPYLDAGLSKTQLLYWIATRQGFNASLVPSSNYTSRSPAGGATGVPTSSSGISASCSNSASCVGLGLVGACCPTAAGVMLECCMR